MTLLFRRSIIVITLFIFGLSACEKDAAEPVPETNAPQADTSQADNQAKPVAVVNGQPITEQDLATLSERKQAQPEGPPSDPQTLVEELINRELIKQAALAKNVDQSEEIRTEVENYRNDLMVQTMVTEVLENLSFPEEALKAEYDKQIADLPDTEYKASHILTNTQEEAQAVIKALGEGQDFTQLAKEKSADPGSAEDGGNLDWFNPATMVEPFAETVKKLKKGEYTKEPVQTQFGWHVISLEDTRPFTPPPYEEVKDRLKAILANQALKDYLAQLRKDAKIEILNPNPPS